MLWLIVILLFGVNLGLFVVCYALFSINENVRYLIRYRGKDHSETIRLLKGIQTRQDETTATVHAGLNASQQRVLASQNK